MSIRSLTGPAASDCLPTQSVCLYSEEIRVNWIDSLYFSQNLERKYVGDHNTSLPLANLKRLFLGLPDPDLLVRDRYGSGSFYHQAK
jgi:hypothetical protein